MYSTHKILAFVYILEIEMTDNYIGTSRKKNNNETKTTITAVEWREKKIHTLISEYIQEEEKETKVFLNKT